MNINEYPEELKNEEQSVLNALIDRMDSVIDSLDNNMKQFVEEAKNADISLNPDMYLSKLMAEKGKRDTDENRKKMLKARDELYRTRLLLKYEEDGKPYFDEIKVGLHSCFNGGDAFVVSWERPLCRHFLLDNASTEYETIVKDQDGSEYHTHYSLLVKNNVELRFTRVVKAVNLFPGFFDDDTIQAIRESGFFSDKFLDEMISRFNPEEYNPEEAAEIISDEFLQELLERRSTPEFKNIVFSIQKKQGEIIQAPYKKNMAVQGCAGSGKSMIMLHRLPILLYDNPNSLSKTNIYVITPSQMYIQLAENMRHQLEIADIEMGTIEQYYDYCISKYPGHKEGEYGKIRHSRKLSAENEQYIYSEECIKDIKDFYENIISSTEISLDEAYHVLGMEKTGTKNASTYSQIISNRLVEIQNILKSHNNILVRYFKVIVDVLESFRRLSSAFRHHKDGVLNEIIKARSKEEGEIAKYRKEIDKLNPEENAVAIKNRRDLIDACQKRIDKLNSERRKVENDQEYFEALQILSSKIDNIMALYEGFNEEFGKNTVEGIYKAIGDKKNLSEGFISISSEFRKTENRYASYVNALDNDIDRVSQSISGLQSVNSKYLDFDYYRKIRKIRDMLSNASSNAHTYAYEFIMEKLGIRKPEKGTIRALKCSPYIYLQTLFLFRGSPQVKRESLLAIDEAQGISPEEIRLLKNINGDAAVFNLYGDINQHIEGTKGVDSWDEFGKVIEFDKYEMQENYRNASQITNYCNKTFEMEMIPINTPGKGVHELLSENDFREEMISQLLDNKRVGLSAILVGNDAEARYLLGEFSSYDQKFHDMTNEDFSIHHTRWNIINIDDAKGLEFSSVIVLSGRMSRNQRYIAYTRALDDLYVYEGLIDVKNYEGKPKMSESEEFSESLDDSSRNEVKLGDNDSSTVHNEKGNEATYKNEGKVNSINSSKFTISNVVKGAIDRLKNLRDSFK